MKIKKRIVIAFVLLFIISACYRDENAYQSSEVSETSKVESSEPQNNMISYPIILDPDIFSEYENISFSEVFFLENDKLLIKIHEQKKKKQSSENLFHFVIYNLNDGSYQNLEIPDFVTDYVTAGANLVNDRVVLNFLQYGFLIYNNKGQLIDKQPFISDVLIGGIIDVKKESRYFIDGKNIMKDSKSEKESVLQIEELRDNEFLYMARVSGSGNKIMSLVSVFEPGNVVGVLISCTNGDNLRILEKNLSYPELAFNKEIPIVIYPDEIEKGVYIYYGDELENTLKFLPNGNVKSVYIETLLTCPEDQYLICRYSKNDDLNSISADSIIMLDFENEKYIEILPNKDESYIKCDISDDSQYISYINNRGTPRIYIDKVDRYTPVNF